MIPVTVYMPIGPKAKAYEVHRALQSLKRQTYPEGLFEIILIDSSGKDHGCSDDTRLGVFLDRSPDLFDARVRRNCSFVAACNVALYRARGRYFVRLDCDDTVEPRWLEELINLLEDNPGCLAVCSCRYEAVDGRKSLARIQEKNLYSIEGAGTVLRTDVVRFLGGFRELFWSDYDLYLRLLQSCLGNGLDYIGVVKQPLYTYNKHDFGLSGDYELNVRGWLEMCERWSPQKLAALGSREDLNQAILEFMNKESE